MAVVTICKDFRAQEEEICDKPRQCVEKQRHYSAIKVYIVKAMVFPAVMNGCETGL